MSLISLGPFVYRINALPFAADRLYTMAILFLKNAYYLNRNANELTTLRPSYFYHVDTRVLSDQDQTHQTSRT